MVCVRQRNKYDFIRQLLHDVGHFSVFGQLFDTLSQAMSWLVFSERGWLQVWVYYHSIPYLLKRLDQTI